MGKLEGKVAIITGASNGMGAMHARKMIAEGAKVVMTDIAVEAGEKLAKELGENAKFTKLNVTDYDEWKKVVDFAVDNFGKIDVLVNNAGIGIFKLMEDLTIDEFNKTMSINTTSIFLSMKAVAPEMIRNGGGSIINISSVDGIRGEAYSVAYGASKFAVSGMTKSAAIELGPAGIRVNAVNPGAVKTDMADENEEIISMAELEKNVPLRRAALPEDVSALVIFLASDDSSYITGTDSVIDGGKTCGVQW